MLNIGLAGFGSVGLGGGAPERKRTSIAGEPETHDPSAAESPRDTPPDFFDALGVESESVSTSMHDRATPARGGTENVPPPPRYRAFISYSHADSKWASWLMRRLEGYRVSGRFHGRAAPIGEVGARIAPVFRDRDELPTTSDLGEAVRAALRESATLVVVCSPASAKSRWVREEIVAFKRVHGEARVFAFIVAGEPKAEGMDEDCFSPALRRELGADGELSSRPAEVVAADARPDADGKEAAFIRLVAGLLGVGFDDLRQRELHRRYRRMTWIAIGAVVGMAITIGLAAMAMVARNDAQRRQEQGEKLLTMLNDLRAQLKRDGKVEALEKIGIDAMAFFRQMAPRDLTDPSLAEHVKALRQLGEVQMLQLRYREASESFVAAYDRAAALAARHSANGNLLFERGQTEYWIGYVFWRQGELNNAERWMSRYRDTGVALVALDRSNPKWQGELAYGHRNLAVVATDRGRFDEARLGFFEEQAILAKMSLTQAGDAELQSRIAGLTSWLGTLDEREGKLAEAAARYAEQVRILEDLLKTDPRSSSFKSRLVDALGIEASALAITDRRGDAVERRAKARRLLDSYVAQDPANRTWHISSLNLRLKEAMLMRLDGDVAAARRYVEEACAGLEALSKTESSDRFVTGLLATAWRFEAEFRMAAGRDDAAVAAGRAVEIGRELMEMKQTSDADVGAYMCACVVAGNISRNSGDLENALRHWQTAFDLVSPRLAGVSDWKLLDPAARTLALLGRADESRAIISRLESFGYRPLTPWPKEATR